MPAKADQLDLTPLSPALRREIQDFYQFLLSRNQQKPARRTPKYKFSDICGELTWKGNAVATQRSIRDEW